jgi:hypothetical protein
VSELLGRRTVQLGEERRGPVEVVGADLHELIDPAAVEPGGERLVQLGTGRLREPGVGDLADQDVLEAEAPARR